MFVGFCICFIFLCLLVIAFSPLFVVFLVFISFVFVCLFVCSDDDDDYSCGDDVTYTKEVTGEV